MSTFVRPRIAFNNVSTYLRILGMVFIAFSGLNSLKVLIARILTIGKLFNLAKVSNDIYSRINSTTPVTTIKKSSTFHPSFK